MLNLNDGLRFLKDTPEHVFEFLSDCEIEEDLVKKLDEQRHYLLLIMKHIKISTESEALITKLICRFDPSLLKKMPSNGDNYEYINDPTVIEKCIGKVVTYLRNHDKLNPTKDPNVTLTIGHYHRNITSAHKSILFLECPYFRRSIFRKEFKKSSINLANSSFSDEICRKVVEYFYLSDKDRTNFISTVDKKNLIEILILTDEWSLVELHKQSEEEILNNLGEFQFSKDEIPQWIELFERHSAHKLAMLLTFVKNTEKGSWNEIIEQMNDPVQASKLGQLCTLQEKKIFSTLKTEFGKSFGPLAGIFGPDEWEKYFGTIKKEHIPPLPDNIEAILDSPDPINPSKKVKETHTFFLRPKEVNNEKLTIYNAEKLSNNPKEGYKTDHWFFIRDALGNAHFTKSSWILLRNDVIPGTKNQKHSQQVSIVKKSGYEVPTLFDLMLQHMVEYVSSGKPLYNGQKTSSCCQEWRGYLPMSVRNIKGGAFHTDAFFDTGGSSIGMAGSWVFSDQTRSENTLKGNTSLIHPYYQRFILHRYNDFLL